MHSYYGGTDDAKASLTVQRNRQIWSNRSPPMLNKDEDVGRKIISRAATTTYMVTFQLAYKENKLLPNDDNFIRLRAIKLRNSWYDTKRVSCCSSWSNTFIFLSCPVKCSYSYHVIWTSCYFYLYWFIGTIISWYSYLFCSWILSKKISAANQTERLCYKTSY